MSEKGKPNHSPSRRDFLRRSGVIIGTSLIIPYALSACGRSSSDTPDAEEGNSGNPIVIGHQSEGTGVASIFGYWNDRAANAAVARINEMGGIAGREVQLVTRDSGSTGEQGVDAMRRLIEEDNADFVLGSIIASIIKPSAALAEELTTLYFPSDDVPVTPGEPDANRFVFRLGHNTKMKAQAAYKWALTNLGLKWSFITSDTTWGISQQEFFVELIEANEGEVVSTVVAPLMTEDFTSLFNQIDLDETEVLFHSFFGSAAITFNGQVTMANILDEVKILASAGCIEGLNIAFMRDGQTFITEFPRLLDQIPRALHDYNKELRELVGVDEFGHATDDSSSILTAEHYWVPWVNLNLLKETVEKSGWQSKDDNMALIETLEGFEAKASLDYPTGDFVIRAEDHRAFRNYFIEQTINGRLEVVAELPAATGIYHPDVDYTDGS